MVAEFAEFPPGLQREHIRTRKELEAIKSRGNLEMSIAFGPENWPQFFPGNFRFLRYRYVHQNADHSVSKFSTNSTS